MKFAAAILLAVSVSVDAAVVAPDANDKYSGSLTNSQMQSFMKYTAKQSKSYTGTVEFTLRATLWAATDELINANNIDDSVFFAHNAFSDMTPAEKEARLGSLPPGRRLAEKVTAAAVDELEDEDD